MNRLALFLLVAFAQIIFRNPNDPSIDTSVPVVAFVSPTSGSTYDAGSASSISNVSGTSSVANGIAICRWSNDLGGSGTANTSGNGDWLIPGVLLTVGSNVVTVSCQSSTNVTGTQALTITRSGSVSCNGTTIICIGQSSAGTGLGTSCANQRPITFFNTAANWGGGSTEIDPGDAVHFCGTITTTVTAQASGSSGNPITLFFETGAKLSQAVCPLTGCLNFAGNDFFILDGGVACGPSVAESSCNGIIEATANGTALANHTANSTGIEVDNSDNVEIKNIVVKNIYVHITSATAGGADPNVQNQPYPTCVHAAGATNITIHDATFHDANWCLSFVGGGSFNNLKIHHTHLFRIDHAIALGILTQIVTGVEFHDNHYHDGANWDEWTGSGEPNNLHHDGIHLFSNNTGDITAIMYNELCDGDWGLWHSTSCQFFETSPGTGIMTIKSFNNVCAMQTGSQWLNGCFNNGNIATTGRSAGSTLKYYNNTMMASAANIGYTNQFVTGLDARNNIITTRDSVANGRAIIGAALVSPTVNYNVYASPISGSAFQRDSTVTTYAGWKASGGSFDLNSPAGNLFTMPITGLTESTGAITASFPGATAGLNLCNGVVSCTGDFAALAFDTSAGGTRTPVARPGGSTAWAIGAYQP